LDSSDLEITIKHVGFGVSQILPIIVQGLIMPPGGTLVLEQPEIHLHPKIQSLLFDFLYSLILQGKNIIIETHSDHFITRMRRRVAEDDESALKDKIKLTFVEQGTTDLIFKSLTLDEYGILNIFPDDFIEMPELELEAIVKAQMKKRISKEP
jgi:predicted ATPase